MCQIYIHIVLKTSLIVCVSELINYNVQNDSAA